MPHEALKNIRVIPLAAESLGVRSMCTYVETKDVNILLDAGVSLCPNRFGLPPHPVEFQAIDECRRRIAEAASEAEVVTISHYHFDHHTPSYRDWLSQWTEANETARQIYDGKRVLLKNPKENINYSQRRRAWLFCTTSGKHVQSLEAADGKTFVFSDTAVKFSEAVSHGPDNSMLGWVLMATIQFDQEKFMFAPDVQGPMSDRTLAMILAEKPDLLMIGGPPLYLSTFKVDVSQIQKGLGNLQRIVEATPVTLVEHHVLRDADWHEKLGEVFYSAYKLGNTVLTAAEYLGRKNMFLEATRKQLYIEKPPTKEFEKWMRLGVDVQKETKPPIYR
jgi:predicted metallo-beta-lactamase superfamily hydrolase